MLWYTTINHCSIKAPQESKGLGIHSQKALELHHNSNACEEKWALVGGKK